METKSLSDLSLCALLLEALKYTAPMQIQADVFLKGEIGMGGRIIVDYDINTQNIKAPTRQIGGD